MHLSLNCLLQDPSLSLLSRCSRGTLPSLTVYTSKIDERMISIRRDTLFFTKLSKKVYYIKVQQKDAGKLHITPYYTLILTTTTSQQHNSTSQPVQHQTRFHSRPASSTPYTPSWHPPPRGPSTASGGACGSFAWIPSLFLRG